MKKNCTFLDLPFLKSAICGYINTLFYRRIVNMAVTRKGKTTAGTMDPAERQKKKKLIRGIILLAVLLMIAAGCVLCVYWLKNRMFKENKRFILQHTNIVSSGYWGKDAATTRRLLNKLDLHIGKSNLLNSSRINCARNCAPYPMWKTPRSGRYCRIRWRSGSKNAPPGHLSGGRDRRWWWMPTVW